MSDHLMCCGAPKLDVLKNPYAICVDEDGAREVVGQPEHSWT